MLILLFGILLFGNNPGYSGYAVPERSLGNGKNSMALIFIIEFKDILCSPCGEFLLDFCQSLPLDFQKENTWGIFVLDPDSLHLGEKIIAKKVRGFMDGNGLHFPVFIDFPQAFSALRNQTSQVFFLNSTTLLVQKYDFPLTKKIKIAILEAILSSL